MPSWDGARHLVVWQSTRRGPSDIYGVWVDPAGRAEPSGGFPIAEASSDTLFPDVIFGEDAHLVVWQDLRSRRNWEIYGARVTPDGAVLDPSGLAIGAGPGNRRYPRVAWSGRVFLIVWMQERTGLGWDIAAARVSPDGHVLDREESIVASGPADQARPAVAWNGHAFVASWMTGSADAADIAAIRIGEDGRPLDDQPIVVSAAPGPQRYPAMGAWNGTTSIVWIDGRTADHFALYGARLDREGRVLDRRDGAPLSTAPRLHMFPAVACGADDCLVVWEEEQGSGSPITRVTDVVRDVMMLRWGGAAPGAPRVLVSRAPGNHFTRVAAGPGRFLVVWKDYRSGLAGGFGRFVGPGD